MRAAIYDAAKRTSRVWHKGHDEYAPLVLVVDDEQPVLELVSEVLADEGYRVVTAENGRQALAVVKHAQPLLIVTDLMMPTMNGRVLHDRLRAEPQTAHIPVILMSAAYRSQPGDTFAATISKPFGIDELIDVIERTLPHPIALERG